MFEAVFKLPLSKLSEIPTTRGHITSPYDAIPYMKKFTFPNIAPTIRKIITDEEWLKAPELHEWRSCEQVKAKLCERASALKLRERHLSGVTRAIELFSINDIYFIPYEKILRLTKDNITVSLARNKHYIFLLYRGIVQKIPFENMPFEKRFLALLKVAPMWESYNFADNIAELEFEVMRNNINV